MKCSGSCLCGAVQYEVTGDPITAFFCHCRDCQKSSGSLLHAGVMVSRKDFAYIKGTPASFSARGDSGYTIVRRFCVVCGSGICNELPDRFPDALVIKAGTLDDPHWVKPAFEVFTESRSPWMSSADGIEAFLRSKGTDFSA